MRGYNRATMQQHRLSFLATAGFEAARSLVFAPPDHRLGRVHGHGFRAVARVAAAPDGSAPWAPFPGAEVDALRAALQTVVAPLDYRRLDHLGHLGHLDHPTDEALARYVRTQLEGRLAGPPEDIAMHSTFEQGVDLDAQGEAVVWRRYRFEAAHQLPNVPPGHKCGRMHGHGFTVTLEARASCLDVSSALAYDELDRIWAPFGAELHQACLNDLPGLENPTSEWIAHWLWQRIRPRLPALAAVTVGETAGSGARFDGSGYRIWKDFNLDSAVRLRGAGPSDGRRRIHGHSYRLRLHLVGPLDRVYGWTIDFGDVKTLFGPVFDRLDHRPLYEVPGIEERGSAALVEWIRGQAAAMLPQLARVDLYETPGCGAILDWT